MEQRNFLVGKNHVALVVKIWACTWDRRRQVKDSRENKIGVGTLYTWSSLG